MKPPIAFFTYGRPKHTAAALSALQANIGFSPERLYVFCDGPRRPEDQAAVEATRATVEEMVAASTTVIKREQNWGLAKSIIEGVSTLTEQFGSVIVVEDDLVTSRYFLEYMDHALEAFKVEDRVMQISGHMFPVELKSTTDAIFLPFITSWGWATWKRAWRHFDASMSQYPVLCSNRAMVAAFNLDNSFPYFKMLRRQAQGEIDSWAIRWYLNVFFAKGLTLYPTTSLVSNIGFDGTGTHCKKTLGDIELKDTRPSRFPPVQIAEHEFRIIKKHLRKSNSFLARLRQRLKSFG